MTTSDQVQARLLAVIRSGRLAVHFQPIVDLHDGLIIAYEALTRLAPDSGFADTGELFEAASKHGMLWELESITRRNALAAAADWPSNTKLFLNSTPAVFADSRFSQQLTAEMAAVRGLEPGRLVLEITELSDDQHVPGLTEQVRAVTAAGFSVALDDAGAGASGLNRMMSLRPNWVKLDREFVRGIDNDLLRQNLVRFFVHFARLSGVSVVAEGIESATELQTVTSLGVRFAQGFYLARPGTRDQTMDASFLAQVRARWAAVEAVVPQEMLEPCLGDILRPVGVCGLESPAGQALVAAGQSGDQPGGGGVLVLEGLKPVAWASRASLEAVPPGASVASIRGELYPVACLSGALTLNEAVNALCTRDGDRLADPVVVMSGERVAGVVRVRDLLRVAATNGRLSASGRTRLTGLPTRVRADQHMAEIIRSEDRNDRHIDAAFVDIRAFAEFNARRGNMIGDQLIREVAELLSAVVVSQVHDAFVAHLGDDRFLLTAQAGQLTPHLDKLAAAFDDQCVEDDADNSPPRLRVLHLPGAFAVARHPRDVFRLEQRLRETAHAREATEPQATSYVLTLSDPAPHLRMAA